MKALLCISIMVSVIFAGNIPVTISKNAQYYLANLGSPYLPIRSGLLDSSLSKNNLNPTVNAKHTLSANARMYPEPMISSGKLFLSVSDNNVHVRVTVYDLRGRFVTSIFDKRLNSGDYSVPLDAHVLVSQIYVLNVSINGTSHTMKYVSGGSRSFSSSSKMTNVGSFLDLKKTTSLSSDSILAVYDDINNISARNSEYSVIFVNPDNGFISLFGSFIAATGLQQQLYDSLNKLLIFIPSQDTNFSVAAHYRNGAQNIPALETIAKNKVASLLPAFVGRIEYNRTDTTRQNGTDIINIDVWYRRIFREGLVLDNVSAIGVSLNGAGEITSLRVKWPKLISTGVMNSIVEYDTVRTVMMNIISDTTSARKGISYVKKATALICGVANAWCRTDQNGSMLLSPCISFQTRYSMQNGENPIQFLDIPILKKYYK